MTPTELIAAAERLQRHLPALILWLDKEQSSGRWKSESREVQEDLQACKQIVANYLATVRADDDEPVTVEWVDAETNLDNSGHTYQRRYEIVSSIRLIAEACPGGFKPCELWIGGGDSFTRRSVTRGQVRSLLRALGIEVSNHA